LGTVKSPKKFRSQKPNSPPKPEKSGCGQSSHQPTQLAVGGVWVVPSPGNMHGSSLGPGEPILPAEATLVVEGWGQR